MGRELGLIAAQPPLPEIPPQPPSQPPVWKMWEGLASPFVRESPFSGAFQNPARDSKEEARVSLPPLLCLSVDFRFSTPRFSPFPGGRERFVFVCFLEKRIMPALCENPLSRLGQSLPTLSQRGGMKCVSWPSSQTVFRAMGKKKGGRGLKPLPPDNLGFFTFSLRWPFQGR